MIFFENVPKKCKKSVIASEKLIYRYPDSINFWQYVAFLCVEEFALLCVEVLITLGYIEYIEGVIQI